MIVFSAVSDAWRSGRFDLRRNVQSSATMLWSTVVETPLAELHGVVSLTSSFVCDAMRANVLTAL